MFYRLAMNGKMFRCVKDIASQLVDALVNKDLEFAMGGGAANFLNQSLGKHCNNDVN